MEDEAIAELEKQCSCLKAHNQQLHAALTAVQEKVPLLATHVNAPLAGPIQGDVKYHNPSELAVVSRGL